MSASCCLRPIQTAQCGNGEVWRDMARYREVWRGLERSGGQDIQICNSLMKAVIRGFRGCGDAVRAEAFRVTHVIPDLHTVTGPNVSKYCCSVKNITTISKRVRCSNELYLKNGTTLSTKIKQTFKLGAFKLNGSISRLTQLSDAFRS